MTCTACPAAYAAGVSCSACSASSRKRSREARRAAAAELWRYEVSARWAIPLDQVHGDTFDEMYENARRLRMEFDARSA
jgi:hypothetical protein